MQMIFIFNIFGACIVVSYTYNTLCIILIWLLSLINLDGGKLFRFLILVNFRVQMVLFPVSILCLAEGTIFIYYLLLFINIGTYLVRNLFLDLFVVCSYYTLLFKIILQFYCNVQTKYRLSWNYILYPPASR